MRRNLAYSFFFVNIIFKCEKKNWDINYGHFIILHTPKPNDKVFMIKLMEFTEKEFVQKIGCKKLIVSFLQYNVGLITYPYLQISILKFFSHFKIDGEFLLVSIENHNTIGELRMLSLTVWVNENRGTELYCIYFNVAYDMVKKILSIVIINTLVLDLWFDFHTPKCWNIKCF